MSLAKEVFHCPVGEMLKRLSSRELSEWQAYFILENQEREEKAETRSKDVLIQESLRGVQDKRRRR